MTKSRTAIFLVAFLAISIGIAFAAGEIFVRALGKYDADGTFYFRGRPIPPFALPVRNAKQLIDEYLRDQTGYMAYDADLGWTNRPGSCTRDKKYCANSAGLRSDREFTKAIPPGTLRISLFGDSFIHGHDVDLAGSLAPRLEKALAARGTKAEALNFGVGGFGIDQAYIRYSREGSRFDTDIIVEGLQFENVARHLMVFRLIAYPQSKIPFSKPRFYFEGPSLLVANKPTIPPRRVPEELAHFDRSPLRRLEFYYTDKYRPYWWRHSKLLAVIAEFRRKPDETVDILKPGGEGVQLTLAILDRFKNDARVTGKPFLLVYLPLKENLAAQLRGARDPWQPLVDLFRKDFTIVDPTPRLLALAREKGVDAVAPGHYSAEGNKAVAEALADVIANRGSRPEARGQKDGNR
ncbi:MAG TPA: SGNH/GDSL hydrolase family protein [Thermoanaerobaculia bacterium]|nr:SGNH/GDSL hydrolase family protein [Thermoanaerobaculia bacterium]